uniref:Uncharacterized protein n=1 Tax=Rhizophora mucronata TaxID=61149 RepID=A0A2P2JLY6_RHIMU
MVSSCILTTTFFTLFNREAVTYMPGVFRFITCSDRSRSMLLWPCSISWESGLKQLYILFCTGPAAIKHYLAKFAVSAGGYWQWTKNHPGCYLQFVVHISTFFLSKFRQPNLCLQQRTKSKLLMCLGHIISAASRTSRK